MWKSKKTIRREIATEAMQALITTNATLNYSTQKDPKSIAGWAVQFADALIEELNKDGK